MLYRRWWRRLLIRFKVSLRKREKRRKRLWKKFRVWFHHPRSIMKRVPLSHQGTAHLTLIKSWKWVRPRIQPKICLIIQFSSRSHNKITRKLPKSWKRAYLKRQNNMPRKSKQPWSKMSILSTATRNQSNPRIYSQDLKWTKCLALFNLSRKFRWRRLPKKKILFRK